MVEEAWRATAFAAGFAILIRWIHASECPVNSGIGRVGVRPTRGVHGKMLLVKGWSEPFKQIESCFEGRLLTNDLVFGRGNIVVNMLHH